MAGIESEDWVMGLTCIAEESGNLYTSTYGFRVLRIPKGYRLKIGEGLDSATVEEWHEPWNGEGLPPVGARIEYFQGEKSTEVTVLTYQRQIDPDVNKDLMILAQQDDMGPLVLAGAQYFRPIRTPEQIAAIQRAKDIETLLRDTDYAIEELHAAAVIDAGYRKQEQP